MRRRLFCNNDIVPVGCPSHRVPACLRVCVCVTLPSWPGPQKPAPGMADALSAFARALHALHHHHYWKKMDHSTGRMHRCPSAVPGSMERSFNCTTTTTTMTVMVTKLGLAFVSTAHGTDSGLIKRPGARRIGFGLAASRMWTINGKCSPFPMLLGLKQGKDRDWEEVIIMLNVSPFPVHSHSLTRLAPLRHEFVSYRHAQLDQILNLHNEN